MGSLVTRSFWLRAYVPSLSHLFLSWRELRRSDVLRSWANLFGRTLKKLIFKTLGFGELINNNESEGVNVNVRQT
jgi:hypothetical protein